MRSLSFSSFLYNSLTLSNGFSSYSLSHTSIVGKSPPRLNADIASQSVIRYNRVKTKLDIHIRLIHNGKPDDYSVIEIPGQYAEDMNFPIEAPFSL